MSVSHQQWFEMKSGANRMGHQSGSRLAGMIHVMAVGRVEETCGLHDALLAEKKIWLSVTTDHRELWARSKLELVHVFVLCEALSGSELEEVSRFIRRQWARAKILVLRDGEEFLDDPLYDERIAPDASTPVLIETIEKLLSGEHR
jgi:hypothetical protein